MVRRSFDSNIEVVIVFLDFMTGALAGSAFVVHGKFGNACVAVIAERPAIVSVNGQASATDVSRHGAPH